LNKLTFFFAGLLLIPLIFLPIEVEAILANITNSQSGQIRSDLVMGAVCAAPHTSSGGNLTRVGRSLSVASSSCQRSWIEWDLSSLPTDAQILNVSMTYTVEFAGVVATPPCDIWSMEIRPSNFTTATDQANDLWNDAGAGTQFKNNQATPLCANAQDFPDMLADSTDPSERFRITLDEAANMDLQDSLGVDGTWWAIGMKFDDEVRTAQAMSVIYNFFAPADDGDIFFLEVEYIEPPDGVTDLVLSNLATTTLDLTWTVPDLGTGTLNGSQINFTTPFGNPLTIITNNTNSTTTAVTVSGLAQDTPFSFRVSVWTEVSNNATGNIVNATTLQFGNFTVGGIDLEAVNIDFRTWQFVRTDLNSSAYSLSVIYPDTYNATCQFHFKFANIDLNQSNLATTIPGVGQLEAVFIFNNTASEIIDVLCVNETNPADEPGRFLLTQTNFILLQQFADFRDPNVWGTAGMFGAIDLITLFGVVFATIGFNRINESVGGFFMLVILGVMAFFEIIVWPTALSGAIAVVVMLVVMSTRKV